jgi:hypothetical protein
VHKRSMAGAYVVSVSCIEWMVLVLVVVPASASALYVRRQGFSVVHFLAKRQPHGEPPRQATSDKRPTSAFSRHPGSGLARAGCGRDLGVISSPSRAASPWSLSHCPPRPCPGLAPPSPRAPEPAMTTFAPASHAHADRGDPPHHDDRPPPLHHPHQHQQHPQHHHHHQLHPPASAMAPPIARRPSRDLRHAPSNGAMAAQSGSGATNAPMTVPGGRMGNGNSHGHGQGGANPRGEMAFGGPRSPPNNKNTSHVPCKFYRQGACQAGKACPFLHSDEPLTERAPCKYFTKVRRHTHTHACTLYMAPANAPRETASLARNAPSPTSCPTATS